MMLLINCSLKWKRLPNNVILLMLSGEVPLNPAVLRLLRFLTHSAGQRSIDPSALKELLCAPGHCLRTS